MLRQCRSESDFSRPRHSRAGTRHGHGVACVNYIGSRETASGRPAAFGFFPLPHGVPRTLLSEAYQSQMQVANVKPSNVAMDEEKFIILVQGHECVYNLQH